MGINSESKEFARSSVGANSFLKESDPFKCGAIPKQKPKRNPES